jgi:hypothetical protein
VFQAAIEMLQDDFAKNKVQGPVNCESSIISYRTQVVSGKHFLFKAKIGDANQCLHLLVWRKLDFEISVLHYEFKNINDPLVPFHFRL